MACGIRSGASKQLSPYGRLAVGQLELSDAAMPRASPEVVPDARLRNHRAVVQGAPSHRLVLDGRLCGGVGIAANFVGEHGFVLFAVLILFVEIPRGVPVEILLVSFFVTRDLGSPSGFTNFQDEVELGYPTRHNHHSIDASRLEQRSAALVESAPVDSGLGVVLAGVVSGRDRPASGLKG